MTAFSPAVVASLLIVAFVTSPQPLMALDSGGEQLAFGWAVNRLDNLIADLAEVDVGPTPTAESLCTIGLSGRAVHRVRPADGNGAGLQLMLLHAQQCPLTGCGAAMQGLAACAS